MLRSRCDVGALLSLHVCTVMCSAQECSLGPQKVQGNPLLQRWQAAPTGGGVVVQSLSRARLFVTPWAVCSLLGSSHHGISQARMLEWVTISFSKDFPNPGIEPLSPVLADRFFTAEPPGKHCQKRGSLQVAWALGLQFPFS